MKDLLEDIRQRKIEEALKKIAELSKDPKEKKQLDSFSLVKAAIKNGDAEITLELLKNGAPLYDYDGLSVLHFAARTGQVEVLRQLVVAMQKNEITKVDPSHQRTDYALLARIKQVNWRNAIFAPFINAGHDVVDLFRTTTSLTPMAEAQNFDNNQDAKKEMMRILEVYNDFCNNKITIKYANETLAGPCSKDILPKSSAENMPRKWSESLTKKKPDSAKIWIQTKKTIEEIWAKTQKDIEKTEQEKLHFLSKVRSGYSFNEDEIKDAAQSGFLEISTGYNHDKQTALHIVAARNPASEKDEKLVSWLLKYGPQGAEEVLDSAFKTPRDLAKSDKIIAILDNPPTSVHVRSQPTNSHDFSSGR